MNKETLFDRFARFLDKDYRDYTDDLDQITSLALEAAGPVVELGCGTGRVVHALVQEGLDVVGVDISGQLLAVARAKLENLPGNASYDLVQGDLVSVDLPRNDFALAICTSNTLMHFTSPEEQMAVLRNAHRHLAPGGLLFISLNNPDVTRLIAVDGLLELADEWDDEYLGVHVIKWTVRTVDFAEQLQGMLFIYEESDEEGNIKRTRCPFQLRFLWRNEAEMMLKDCGFEVETVLGDFDGSPYSSVSEYLLLTARKVLTA